MAQDPWVERSKDVYAVVGLLCLDQGFREQFFANPHAAANRLVGSLSQDELGQIERVAGVRGLTGDREAYVREANDAFGNVYAMLRCPIFPCPSPDPFEA
jgi:hypothetical protein